MITFDELKKWSAESEQYASDEPIYAWIMFPDAPAWTGTLHCWAQTVTEPTIRLLKLQTPPTMADMQIAAFVMAVALWTRRGYDTGRMAVSLRSKTGRIYFQQGLLEIGK